MTQCKLVWGYFLETCNRVLSRDPDHNWYKVPLGPFARVLNNRVPSGYSIYYLYRR